MELMQLEMFIAVVEERSVRRAADRVFRTQPAVSLAVGKLEREIGVPLLAGPRRPGRELTRAGEILYEYALGIIGMRNEVLSVFAEKQKDRLVQLRIGADEAADLRWLSQLTRAFNRQYPDIPVRVRRDRSDNLIMELKERKIDFAILTTAPRNQGAQVGLAASLRSGFRREQPLWVVQRRVGHSVEVKAFEEMLITVRLPSERGVREKARVLGRTLPGVVPLKGHHGRPEMLTRRASRQG